MAIEKTPIGLRLARYRKERGFKNAEELAEVVASDAITRSTIVNVELGRKKDLTITETMLIARALNIPPIALVLDIEDLFARDSGIPGFDDEFNFQILDWFTGSANGIDEPNDTNLRMRTILGLYRDIKDFVALRFNLLDEAAETKESAEAEKLASRAKRLEKAIEATFTELAGVPGSRVPSWAAEAFLDVDSAPHG